MIKPTMGTKAELAMAAVAFIWGTTFVLVKDALNYIGPFYFLGFRFTLAFFILAALSFNSIKNIRLSTIKDGSLLGFFLLIGYAFQTIGLKYTTASNAGFITGTSVVMVMVLYYLIQRTWPPVGTIAAVTAAAIGLFLMSAAPGSFKLAYGDLLVLTCALGFALHIILIARYSHRHNPIAVTAVQLLLVGIICLILGACFEPWPRYWNLNLLAALTITAVLGSSLAFLAQNALQQYSTPTRFAIILTLEPIFAAWAGYTWGGDTFSVQNIIGAILILAAMFATVFIANPAEHVEK